MKYQKIIFYSILLSVLIMPMVVLAQGDLEKSITDELAPVKNIYDPVADVNPGTLQTSIAKAIRAFLAFLGIIFLILIIYGGFTWMTSRGDQSQIEKARKTLGAAIIGVAIIAASYAITYFVFDVLFYSGSGFAN